MRKYITFDIINIEPLKVEDRNASKPGETATMHYIPGTTVRGMIINAISESEKFGEIKAELLSDKTAFFDAYPTINGKMSIPSLMGFYESKKGDGSLQNVLVQDPDPAFKRAGLGDFCQINDDTVSFGTIAEREIMNTNINYTEKNNGKQMVFRSDAIRKGYCFKGIIAVSSDAVQSQIEKVLNENGDFFIGSSRSSGFGKIVIQNVAVSDELPYSNSNSAGSKETIYLAALSPLAFRDNETGEICGFNEGALTEIGQRLGVNNLRLEKAATSVAVKSGVNRMWAARTQSIPAYLPGSVFKLVFEGTASSEKIRELEDEGLGIMRNEGWGCVVVLPDYPKIVKKVPAIVDRKNDLFSIKAPSKDNEAVKKLIARTIVLSELSAKADSYVYEKAHELKKALGKRDSHLHVTRSMIKGLGNDPATAEKRLESYYSHHEEKQQKERRHEVGRKSKGKEMTYVSEIFNGNLFSLTNMDKDETVLGFKVSDLVESKEEGTRRMFLINDLLEFTNRIMKKEVGQDA